MYVFCKKCKKSDRFVAFNRQIFDGKVENRVKSYTFLVNFEKVTPPENVDFTGFVALLVYKCMFFYKTFLKKFFK